MLSHAQDNPLFSSTPTDLTVRPARKKDLGQLTRLIRDANYFYRHLDWCSPLDWLGQQPFWVIEQKNKIAAALACPPDPPDIYWVRLFTVSPSLRPSHAWRMLFSEIKNSPDLPQGSHLYILAIPAWLENLLLNNGFQHHQSITILKWHEENFERPAINKDLILRPMNIEDISTVFNIDNASFSDIWQLSNTSLSIAYLKSAYATAAIYNNEIVGYQISTSSKNAAHLARLAVLPQYQRLSFGTTILIDMIEHFITSGIDDLSVNTQSDNIASLAAYKKVGFLPTDEQFPILKYRV